MAAIVYNFFFTLPFIWNSLLLLINTILFLCDIVISNKRFHGIIIFQTFF